MLLLLREGAESKYCKVRRLPLALKSIVSTELDRLEKEQVLEKITHSDWATLLVVIRKPGGKERLIWYIILLCIGSRCNCVFFYFYTACLLNSWSYGSHKVRNTVMYEYIM